MFKLPNRRFNQCSLAPIFPARILGIFCTVAFAQQAASKNTSNVTQLSNTESFSQTNTSANTSAKLSTNQPTSNVALTNISRRSPLTTSLKTSSTVQHLIIFGLLLDRCAWYLPQAGASAVEKKKTEIFCLRLSYEFLKSLDSKIITDIDPVTKKAKDGMTVVFVSDLKALFQEKKILKYLQDMKTEIEFAYENRKKFDLYSFTLAQAGSQFEALRWIATLLQDTSSGQSVIEWLKRNPTTQWSRNPKLTEEIISEFNEINYFFTKELPLLKAPHPNFNFYPGATDASLMNIQFYHFYVPAYLASKLSKNKFSKPFAAFAPFILNYLYEVSNGAEAVSRVWNEPKTIKDLKTQEDIYLGYFGPLWALGLGEKALRFSNFKEGLRNRPSALLYAVTQDSWVLAGLGSRNNRYKIKLVTEPTGNLQPLAISQCESKIANSKRVVQLRVQQCREYVSYQSKSDKNLFGWNESASAVAGSDKLSYKIEWQTLDFVDPIEIINADSINNAFDNDGFGFSTGDAMTQCLDNRPAYDAARIAQSASLCR